MAKLSQLFDLIKTETVEDTDVIAAVRDIEDSAEDVAFTVADLLKGKPNFDMGSNENGSWLKLYTSEDAGVMVCWIDRVLDVSSSSGSHNEVWTYPQGFSEPPATILSAGGQNSSVINALRGLGTQQGGADPTSGLTQASIWYHFDSGVGQWSFRPSAIAIGTFDETP